MKRILLAEDRLLQRKLAQKALKAAFQSNISLDIVENGLLAVQKIKEGKKYDLIVLDIQMPLLDGVKASLAIQGLGCTVPIVAHTALPYEEAKVSMRKGKMNDFALKSVEGKLLVQLVAKHTGLVPQSSA